MSEGGLELGTFCSRERYLNRSATAPQIRIFMGQFLKGNNIPPQKYNNGGNYAYRIALNKHRGHSFNF